MGWGLAGFSAGLLLDSFGQLGLPTWYLPFTSVPADTQSDRQPIVFGSDAGLVLNYIKPEKTVAFDFMIAQLKAAMEQSRVSTLCDQAARWKILRSSDSGPDGTAVYVFTVDPGPRNIDYRVSTVVAEAIHRNPAEFYQKLLNLYASRQTVIQMIGVWAPRRLTTDRALVGAKQLP
jgi:hypothetical protein